jgi:FdhE protein
MSFLRTGKVNYRARIERAATLTERLAFARELLSVYGEIARFQKGFYEQLPKLLGKRAVDPAGSLRTEFHLAILLEPFGRLLKIIAIQIPGALGVYSQELKNKDQAEWESVLTRFWKSGLLDQPDLADPILFEDFVARAALQPYAEFLASSSLPPVLPKTVCRCPRCNSLPLLGVLRPEGDGAKRFLQCAFCSLEWEFRRILCAHCGEEEEGKLPVYLAEQFPHIRMECCESCKHFLRTIDLTKDGHAVPIVDDLAAIPLSLWAAENGYRRIQSNLLGT